jgi:UDP-2,3-diacylglucosamine hydrolase
MEHATLFISDLHLCAERPAITRLFLDFLDSSARRAQALYILGDLFEYWIGDEAALEEYRPVVEGLRRLGLAGTSVFVLRGNRDFLMGEAFEKAAGCRLLPDLARIDLYGTPVLLMHGDTLCTRDTEYLTFRAMVRDPAWQKAFLAKSVGQREAIARNYRELSRFSTANKKPEIMDVTQEAVEETMRSHDVHHLIHGHTHRPGEHAFDLDGAQARRIVLGDWYDRGSVLRCTAAEWKLETLPGETTNE